MGPREARQSGYGTERGWAVWVWDRERLDSLGMGPREARQSGYGTKRG